MEDIKKGKLDGLNFIYENDNDINKCIDDSILSAKLFCQTFNNECEDIVLSESDKLFLIYHPKKILMNEFNGQEDYIIECIKGIISDYEGFLEESKLHS